MATSRASPLIKSQSNTSDRNSRCNTATAASYGSFCSSWWHSGKGDIHFQRGPLHIHRYISPCEDPWLSLNFTFEILVPSLASSYLYNPDPIHLKPLWVPAKALTLALLCQATHLGCNVKTATTTGYPRDVMPRGYQ